MVATTYIDPLDIACHTGLMSDIRPRLITEMAPHEVRFTARDPLLDESLARLESEGARQAALAERGEPYDDRLPRNLFLFAMKRLIIDTTDTVDGTSQNLSTFGQYRQGVLALASHGQKRFNLDPWMQEVRAGEPDGELTGVLLRVRVDQFSVGTMFAPPFYELETYREMLRSLREDPQLGEDRHSAFIPVHYKVDHAAESTDEPLERLRSTLSLGAWVSQLTIVPSTPKVARLNDIFNQEHQARTYGKDPTSP
jgi:hypothetical protein